VPRNGRVRVSPTHLDSSSVNECPVSLLVQIAGKQEYLGIFYTEDQVRVMIDSYFLVMGLSRPRLPLPMTFGR
jgi:hypothetical protein